MPIVMPLLLQDSPAGPPLADSVQQPASSEPSFASIACKPGIDGVLPSIIGGQGLAGMSANFTGMVKHAPDMALGTPCKYCLIAAALQMMLCRGQSRPHTCPLVAILKGTLF